MRKFFFVQHRPDSASPDENSSARISLRANFFASGGLLNLCIYVGLVSLLVLNIFTLTNGHFGYTLDDPYIHLALAQRIRHGLYGLNTGEFASPSSSILWPLLLVPFTATRLLVYVPFLLSFLFGSLTAVILSLCTQRIFAGGQYVVHVRVRLLNALLILAINLPALTLTGMEHVLQVLLSVCCAYGVICMMLDGEAPTWTLIAAIVLPSVRYEGILITGAVVISLYSIRKFAASVTVLLSSTALPIAFSFYLLHLGLPAFPLSVLQKSRSSLVGSGTLGMRIIANAQAKSIDTLRDSERSPELLLAIALGYLAYRNRNKRIIFSCTAAAFMVACIQVVLGPNGWFYRYEIYAVAFTAVMAIAAEVFTPTPGVEATKALRAPQGSLLLAVSALAATYMIPLLTTPEAARSINEQQRQLGRLTQDFYHGAIAVNDLGMVSFKRDPDNYVLDLYGLGSKESASVRPDKRTAQWLDSVTRKHHVGLVAIYPEWFPEGAPSDWIRVAKLCSTHLGTVYSTRVMLYEADPYDLSSLESALVNFSKTLPPTTVIQMFPADTDSVCRSR